VEARQREFADFQEELVVEGNLLRLADNTVVSPANGYCLMDGGDLFLLISPLGMLV
jgi:putative hemolysin